MMGGIQMEGPDDFFRLVEEVTVDEGEKSQARHQDQPSLGALEDGDHPQTAWLGFFHYPIHRAIQNAAVAAMPPMPTDCRPPVSGRIPVSRPLTAPNVKRASNVTDAEIARPLSAFPVVMYGARGISPPMT